MNIPMNRKTGTMDEANLLSEIMKICTMYDEYKVMGICDLSVFQQLLDITSVCSITTSITPRVPSNGLLSFA